ncbi:gamma-glutamyltransferase family protein [Hutsoniella sourekii]|uniref:gamma-glutamyltransferase family protein n=1 Tax=Hutsoniella sourekii TaxID=87650 RepID=UPI0004B7B10E|nr:gamma-glutamyltransferase family protein [Hutsoniella sourekii]
MEFNKYSYRYPSRRSLQYGKKGMVASSNPIVSQIGLDVLKAGGNAIDATVAAAAAIAVMEPISNGLGTDNNALVYYEGKMYGLNATGPAPALTDYDGIKSRARSGKYIQEVGWDPVTVPGTVAGWVALNQRFGTMSLVDLLEPAAKLAEEGFPLQTTVADVWKNNIGKYRQAVEIEPAVQTWFDTFLPDGRVPEPGDIYFNQEMADTIREIAATSGESFYRGAIADDIDAFARETGGSLRKEDLASFEVEWVEPITANYRGYDVWQLPPNGQGIITLEALKILENFEDLSDCDSPLVQHRLIDACKMAIVDGVNYIGDPRFNDLDYDHLYSVDHARERFQELDDQAAWQPPNGEEVIGGTIYFSIMDGQGNGVSFIQSNCKGFGSGLVVPGRGIALHCRGTHFSLDPDNPNCLAPGKRPYHTTMPGYLTKGDRNIGPYGCMGGTLQPQAHVQMLNRIIDGQMNPQESLDAPRWQWKRGRQIEVEPHMPFNQVKQLIELGHEVQIVSTYDFFGRGQVVWLQENGALVGATDGRTDGSIAAY